MAAVYEYATLTDLQRNLLIQVVQDAIPKARGIIIADDLRELLVDLCNAHKVVLKNKHMRAA